MESSQLDNFGKDSANELKCGSASNVEQVRQSDVEINIKYNESFEVLTTETDNKENVVNVRISEKSEDKMSNEL